MDEFESPGGRASRPDKTQPGIIPEPTCWAAPTLAKTTITKLPIPQICHFNPTLNPIYWPLNQILPFGL